MCSLSIYPFSMFEISIKFIKVKFCTICTCLNLILYISILLLYANRFWLYEVVLKLSSDIEENPRPKPSSKQSLFINHSNLNITFAHNYTRIHIYS